jgi:hypothetical protein
MNANMLLTTISSTMSSPSHIPGQPSVIALKGEHLLLFDASVVKTTANGDNHSFLLALISSVLGGIPVRRAAGFEGKRFGSER